MSSVSNQPASLSANMKISYFYGISSSTNFIANTFYVNAILKKDSSDYSF